MNSEGATVPHAARQKFSRILAPAVAIVVLYALVLYMPLRRELNERLSKLHKLEEVARHRAATQAPNQKQLAALEAEIRSLDGELNAARAMGAHLVTRRDDRREQVFATQSPASRLAETLRLLDRHGLVCLDSTIAERAAKADDESLKALSPVASLLGATPGQDGGRREVRLTLSGNFARFHRAIEALGRELRGVFILSLEMQPPASPLQPDGDHIWILSISV